MRMWTRGGTLILAVVLLATLHQHHFGSAKKAKVLDLAPAAVDYLCEECPADALHRLVASGLLRQELNASSGFKKAWDYDSSCTALLPGGTPDHTAALLAYTNADLDFLKTFNQQVETMGGNISTYRDHFPFKSFHFLLMDAMRLQCGRGCATVYVAPEQVYEALPGTQVRLGRFTTAYRSFTTLKNEMDLDGDVVVFNITSCFFSDLGSNICRSEEEVLLSPAEVFNVSSVNRVSTVDYEYTHVVLTHLSLETHTDTDTCPCSRSSVGAPRWPLWALLLLTSSLFFFC